MHKEVVEVALLRPNVLLSRESSKAFLVHEYAQGVHPVYHHVDPQVELQVVNQVRLREVPLSHHLVTLLYLHVLRLPHQVDSPTLAHVDRLDNERLDLLFAARVELALEVGHLCGQDPRLREEVVVVLEGLEHAHQVSAEVVLAGECIHPRKVVDPLMRLHALQLFWRDAPRVAPVDVPVPRLVVRLLEAQLLAGLFYHHVVALGSAQVYVLYFLLLSLLQLITSLPWFSSSNCRP